MNEQHPLATLRQRYAANEQQPSLAGWQTLALDAIAAFNDYIADNGLWARHVDPGDPVSEDEVARLPWNESNPEWWQNQIEHRLGLGGDIAWRWLVNEWAALSAVPEGAASVPYATAAYHTGDTFDYPEPGNREVPAKRRAAVPSPEPLDVERLAEAIWHAETGDDLQYADPREARKFAAAIAREYARLATPQSVQEEPTHG